MYSCADRTRRLIVLVIAVVLGSSASGCASHSLCAAESCDGQDNDCDGKIDEDFRDSNGAFSSIEHCGACDVACAKVFPTATATECVAAPSVKPECRISACAAGQTLAGSGACVPIAAVLCLPCETDADCMLRSTDARCLPATSSGMRCGSACVDPSDCPSGFVCNPIAGGKSQCQPIGGSCACCESTVGADFACDLKSTDGDRVCAGVAHCTATGLSACEAALTESCNGLDDDCDGAIDETFTNADGLYIDQNNCGACGSACAPAGPHLLASCAAVGGKAICQSMCETGYVDVNGIATDGCECQLSTEHAPIVGGDGNCDGVIDDTPGLVFVSQGGDDRNDGSDPSAPVASIGHGMEIGAVLGRSVLVARGIYTGSVSLVDGVTLVGGYSPDFRQHDPELYPVMLEPDPSQPGAPVLHCQDNTKPTFVSGLTIAASDAIATGQGSTAVWLDGCDEQLELDGITVLAGRGASGAHGADSSDRLSERGLRALSDLAGVDGSEGEGGGYTGCAVVAAGSGGRKACAGDDVSGGDGGAARCAAISCSNDGSVRCGNAGCTDFTDANGVCDIAAARRTAVPNPSASSGRGSMPGSAAESTYDAPTDHAVCTFCDDNPSLARTGGAGGDGRGGDPGGAGAACTSALTLDSLGRANAGGGGLGSDGSDGSGGGGGSAGAGYAVIAGTDSGCSSVAGGAGGGAGSGGCGAPGAAGGGGGGASIGILIALPAGNTQGPVLNDVRIVTASAGDGGDGGVGASGGAGGFGGLGGVSNFWCARSGGRGGDGGPGGAGGGGGGGCGGASYGIYLASKAALASYRASLASGSQIEVAGAAGRGGRGGYSPGQVGTSGIDGTAVAIGSL